MSEELSSVSQFVNLESVDDLVLLNEEILKFGGVKFWVQNADALS